MQPARRATFGRRHRLDNAPRTVAWCRLQSGAIPIRGLAARCVENQLISATDGLADRFQRAN